jgi:hypothetical protein
MQLSHSWGFHGRVGLHALSRAAGFYHKIGMKHIHNDPKYGGLPYFEFDEDAADRFRKGQL